MNVFLLNILSCVILSCGAHSYTYTTDSSECTFFYDSVQKRTIYTYVDKMPEYKGSMNEVLLFFNKQFSYPEQEIFQGSIRLEFIINEKGEIINPKIVSKENDNITPAEKEALRVLKLMPKWNPGECHGRRVPVKMYLPIKF